MSEQAKQSSDKLTEPGSVSANSPNIIASGVIELTPSNFSGLFASKDTIIATKYVTDTTTALLLNDFEVYHYIPDPLHEMTAEQVDEMIRKVPYSYNGVEANVNMSWRSFAGSPSGVYVKLYIEYTAPSSSGTPLSSDTTQYFYYRIYSSTPF